MRYETDDRCPRPTPEEERRALGRSAGLVLAVIIGSMVVSALLALANAATSNVYWRVDLNQGTSIIAYGQGATEQAAWDDCFRLQGITRAMTAAETRKSAVGAVTTTATRWCKNPVRFATVTPDGTDTATLSWTPPTKNSDGTPLTDLAGYRIVHGTDPNALVSTIQIDNPAVSAYTVTKLTPGQHYFAVKSFNTSGNESPVSNVLSKVIL